MTNHFETIVAPITAVPGPVAMIRLSGPEAWDVASRVFAPWRPEAMKIAYGRLVTGDDGFAVPFEPSRSYTGEASVEISMHGSVASVGSAVEACVAAGARVAEPGEFTLRAFVNGRLDLTQAEAVRDSIDAKTELQLRIANRQRSGALQVSVRAIRSSIARVLAELEATIDFSEEIGDFDRANALSTLSTVRADLDRLRQTADLGRWIRNGLRVAIVGAPNAGKSSLLNRLVGADRAIVTAIPGTTRDTVEGEVIIGGVPVRLVDTAGIRESDDIVEAEGIRRSFNEIRDADLIMHVVDSACPANVNIAHASHQTVWTIANKSDLGTEPPFPFDERVSARTGDGLDRLLQRIRDRVAVHDAETPIAPRHEVHIRATIAIMDDLIAALGSESSNDLLSVLLNDALLELGKITGETADVDMIHRIFHDFCVGK